MSEEYIVDVDHVTIRFNLASEKVDNLKEYVIRLLKHQLMFQEFLNSCKLHDFIEMLRHKFLGMAQHRAVQINIFPGCHIRVKTRAKLDQRRDRPIDRNFPLRRF